MWLCGCVAMWLCGHVAAWQCGCVAMWLCGYVAVWLCGYVWLQRLCPTRDGDLISYRRIAVSPRRSTASMLILCPLAFDPHKEIVLFFEIRFPGI